MTKATGKRELQKRREALFDGELRLVRALDYLRNVARLARDLAPGSATARGYEVAIAVVFRALRDLRVEAAAVLLAKP